MMRYEDTESIIPASGLLPIEDDFTSEFDQEAWEQWVDGYRRERMAALQDTWQPPVDPPSRLTNEKDQQAWEQLVESFISGERLSLEDPRDSTLSLDARHDEAT